ncbi:MAG: hypothetical protein L0Z49_12560 [Actinobacteria bacterium]|nr:hypothetical protein [Actinomycetota bacterium]
MGQDVVIRDVVTVGDVIVIDTDRSFTGQDGEVNTPESGSDGIPAMLADRLFSLGLGVDHVFVQQNLVTVRRPGGWDEDTAERVAEVTATFLRFYDEEE